MKTLVPRAALFLLVLVGCVFLADLMHEHFAKATSNPVVLDKTLCTGAAGPSGGTYACNYALAADKAYHLTADVGMSALDAGHLWGAAGFSCDTVVESFNGTLAIVPAATWHSYTALNPLPAVPTATITGLLSEITSRGEGADSIFSSAGAGTTSTCTWSVSGTNAIVTVTNNGTGPTADVTIYVTAFVFGSH
jgi:hypothetical protein